MGKSSPIIGMTAIGIGILLLWSAYTKKAVFGTGGIIREVIGSGGINSAAGAVGKAAGTAVNTVKPVKNTGTSSGTVNT
jgi:hypothetical protein